MDAKGFELYLAGAVALILAAIGFAALLRFAIRNDHDASSALLQKGNPALGLSSTVSTLNTRFLLPWVSLPSLTISPLALFAFWAARVSSWSSMAMLAVGLLCIYFR